MNNSKMKFIEHEFEELKKMVENEGHKYLSAEVTVDNYDIPHAYLSKDEIKRFKSDCKKYGLKIKAISLVDYMKLNNCDNEQKELKENNVEKIMKYLGQHFKGEKSNILLGNKRSNKFNDNINKDGDSYFSNINIPEFSDIIKRNKKQRRCSSMRKSIKNCYNNIDLWNAINKSVLYNNKNEKIIFISEKKNNITDSNEIYEEVKNSSANSYKVGKNLGPAIDRMNELINIIINKSKQLPKDVLIALAKKNKFNLFYHNTKIIRKDLESMDMKQLDNIRLDISFNLILSDLNQSSKNTNRIKKAGKSVQSKQINERKYNFSENDSDFDDSSFA